MLADRLARYMTNDSIERYRVEFLKNIVEKTEKGEFNCTLCHTLNRIFTLAKKSKLRKPEMALFLQKIQEQIYLTLSKIRSPDFDPVDQAHYLKVFFLLFLQQVEV